MIIKFQSGGTFVPPLVSYQPVTVTGGGRQVAAADASTSKESSDLTDKDLLQMMEKLEGLPSDMAKLTETLQNFYIEQQYSPFPQTSNIASRYLSALSQMRTANFFRKEYDDAYAAVNKNGGINEYAVDSRGYLFCMNKDSDFKLIRPEDLKNNEGYSPLTNSELLSLRANDPSLAYNSSILGVVKNGIGMESITKMILDIIDGMGSNDTKQGGYLSTQQGQLIGGLLTLQNAIALAQQQNVDYNGTTQDLYSYQIVNKNQKAQIDQAMAYIYQALPENAKSIIKTRTKTGSNEEVIQFINALVSSKMSGTVDYTVKLEGGPTANKSAKDQKGEDADTTKLSPAALLQAGYGLKETFTIQTAQGGSNGLQIDTVKMPIVSKEGKSIGIGTLNDVASSGFAGFLDFEHATMGGVQIQTNGLGNVAVNGTSLYVGELPIDMEEYNKTGLIRPDIAMLGRLKQAQNKIKQEKITDPQQINKVYEEFRLPVMYGPNGNIVGNYRKFGIVNGTALEQAFDGDAEFADYLQETTDEHAIKNTLSIINRGAGKDSKVEFTEKGWWNSIWDSYDHVYKGTVFIPVNEDYFTSAAGFGQFPTAENAALIEAKQQAMEREKAAVQSYVNPGLL